MEIKHTVGIIAKYAAAFVCVLCLFFEQWNEATAFGVLAILITIELWIEEFSIQFNVEIEDDEE